MKTRIFERDWLQDYWDNPKKREPIIKLFPARERPMIRKVADLILGVSYNEAEFAAHKAIMMAKLMGDLEKRFRETGHKEELEDPIILIEAGPMGAHGSDPFPYLICYQNLFLALPKYAGLSKDGGKVSFIFPRGLPVGSYLIWLYWHPVSGMKEFKVKCSAIADPNSAVKPYEGTTVVQPDHYDYTLSAIEMNWDIVAANKVVIFCLENISGESLMNHGVCLFGAF